MTLGAVLGLSYGSGLGLLAFFCTGAGHGTYIPVIVSSSPLGLLGVPIPIAVFGAPVIWLVVGLLLVKARAALYRRLFVALVLGHYAVALGLVLLTHFGAWHYVVTTFRAIPGLLVGWVVLYLVGKMAIWYRYATLPSGETTR